MQRRLGSFVQSASLHHLLCMRIYRSEVHIQGGDAGGQAAITELIQEATLLSRIRHPNVVWVYGVVLKPMSKDDESNDEELHDQEGG